MSQAVTNYLGPLSSWSYSTHSSFSKCPKQVYYAKVAKEPRPALTPPPGKDEHPLTRGIRVHESAEDFVKTDCELIDELQKFTPHFHALREMYRTEQFEVCMEDPWAFDKDWKKSNWKSSEAWLRLKVDCLVIDHRTHEAVLIDFKTGRRFGNEVAHQLQGQLYQLCAFLLYPELEAITVEFWYTDVNEISRITYKRSFGLQFMALFQGFGDKICNEVIFKPTPSSFACKWCDYGSNVGGGQCTSDLFLAEEKSK